MNKQLNWYTAAIKEGKHKNLIVAEGYGSSRKEFIERHKQSLIDAGVHTEAAGYVFGRNYRIITRKES